MIFSTAFLGLSLHCAIGAAPAEGTPILSLNEAVQTALSQQPQLRQSHAFVDAASARADEARASLLPQLTAYGIYTRRTANFVAAPGSFPGGTSTTSTSTSERSFNYFQFGATASQLIWDFNFSWDRWRAAQSVAQAQYSSELATRLQIILAVQVSYLTAAARRDLIQVARDNLTNQKLHLTQVEGFVRVGVRAEIDLAQARTDEANARVLLINAENNYQTAKAQLNQAIGIERSEDYEIGNDTVPLFAGEDATVEPLLAKALQARPEFAGVEQQVRAQQFLVRSAKGPYFPSLGVSAGVTENGRQLDQLTWNWSAQAQLQWNLFQGFLTNSTVHEANATLIGLQAQRDLLRQQVRLEIEQARLSLRGAKETLSAAGEALENAMIRLKLAQRRYQTGVGSAIELGDAQVAATSAAAQEVGARYSVAIARAQLLKALGES